MIGRVGGSMNNRGQALVEFVLILPILIIILFSVIDFGMIYSSKSTLENDSADIIDLFKGGSTIDEIRNIYSRLVSGADVEEVNPYNLKTMGFLVYSRYVVQNHNSLDAYFYNLLTKEDVQDISRYKKRF